MTETISIYTYVQGFQQFETSYTAAIAFLIIALLTVDRHLGHQAHGARPMIDAAARELPGGRSREPCRSAARGGAPLIRRRYVCGRMLAPHPDLIFIFPVYWLFIISFKTPDEIFAFPPVWYPESIQFANYRGAVQGRRCGDGVEQPGAGRASRTVIAMVLGHHRRLRLVRFKTGGENLAVWIISQRMMPPIAIVFPIFLLYVFSAGSTPFTASSSSTPPSACPM